MKKMIIDRGLDCPSDIRIDWNGIPEMVPVLNDFDANDIAGVCYPAIKDGTLICDMDKFMESHKGKYPAAGVICKKSLFWEDGTKIIEDGELVAIGLVDAASDPEIEKL